MSAVAEQEFPGFFAIAHNVDAVRQAFFALGMPRELWRSRSYRRALQSRPRWAIDARSVAYEWPTTLVICKRSSGLRPTNSNPERTLEVWRTIAIVVRS